MRRQLNNRQSSNAFIRLTLLATNNKKNVAGIVINAFTEPFVVERSLFDMVEKMKSRIELFERADIVGATRFGYFDYAIRTCDLSNITRVCSVMSTREELIESLNKSFENEYCRISDRVFVEALLARASDDANKPLDSDATYLLDRCTRALREYRDSVLRRGGTEYEKLFEIANDVCWLLASTERRPGHNQKVGLLVKPSSASIRLKNYLSNCFETGILNKQQCEYISEALDAKRQFLPILYDYEYDKAWKLVLSGATNESLNRELSHCCRQFNEDLSLFYGLTVTCMLETHYRGMFK